MSIFLLIISRLLCHIRLYVRNQMERMVNRVLRPQRDIYESTLIALPIALVYESLVL